MTATLSSEPDIGQRNRVTVRLLVWGATDEQAEHADRRAREGDSRRGWDFVNVELLAGAVCPINTQDPKVIAADAGADWAYAVYRTDI